MKSWALPNVCKFSRSGIDDVLGDSVEEAHHLEMDRVSLFLEELLLGLERDLSNFVDVLQLSLVQTLGRLSCLSIS